jgi:hypothetical protein
MGENPNYALYGLIWLGNAHLVSRHTVRIRASPNLPDLCVQKEGHFPLSGDSRQVCLAMPMGQGLSDGPRSRLPAT